MSAGAWAYLVIALILAAIVPLALIATRNELRKVRLRLVEELRTTLFKDDPNLPQLELAAARYRAEDDRTGQTRQALVRVWTGAFFFITVSFLGFALLLMPRDVLLSATTEFPRITFALLWTEKANADLDTLAQTVTVVAVAFLGGFVFQLRYLIRATLNQELGALAFVRAMIHILQGMIIALVAYRVGADMIGFETGTFGFAAGLAAAFLFGLYPVTGLAQIAKVARIRRKDVDQESLGASKVISLEVIEGIDSETAYRLEESNLYDVQNLATINPIGLYAESPFPLLQIFDWVLQAQLCTNVGVNAFIALKAHRIRTIFDLERGVLAEGAPDAYVRAIGTVMFAQASPDFRRRVGLPATAEEEPLPGVEMSTETVRHAVAIILDDFHIHRLRSLWRIMLKSTAGAGARPWLFETGAMPGDVSYSDLRLKEPAEALVQLATHYGGEYRAMARADADADALAAKRAQALEAARGALEADRSARERLRRMWNPSYLGKRHGEDALEPFYEDDEFQTLLDPQAAA